MVTYQVNGGSKMTVDEKTISTIAGLLESGLEKLKILPRRVVDPVKWMQTHKPEMLKDPDIQVCLVVAGGDIKKIIRKFLRKKSSVRYFIGLDQSEKDQLRDVLDVAVVGYDYNIFYVNMAKGLLKEYWEYRIPQEIVLNSREMVMITKGIVNMLEIVLDDDTYANEEEKIEYLKFMKSFLEKEIMKKTSTYIPSLEEDGTMGKGSWVRKKEKVTVMSVISDKMKKGLGEMK